MNIIIQCAGRKNKNAGFLQDRSGKRVCFVGRPELACEGSDCIYARPDDVSDVPGISWRQRLESYASEKGSNPLHLLKAYLLYKPKPYAQLVEKFGEGKVFILSAGWGLVRADYPLPGYDITFSKTAEKKKPYVLRSYRKDVYRDFQQLPLGDDSPLVFLGGKDYLPFFLDLIRPLQRKVVIFSRVDPVAEFAVESLGPRYEVRPYKTSVLTNWHYQCAQELASGSLHI